MACHSTSHLAQPCSDSGAPQAWLSVPHLALQSQLVDEADEARNQDRKRQYGVFCSIPAEPLDRTAEIRREEVHREQHLMTITAACQRSLSSKPGTHCVDLRQTNRAYPWSSWGSQCPTYHSQLRKASVGYHVCRMHRELCARILHAAKALAAFA